MTLHTADTQLLADLFDSPARHWRRFIDRYAGTVVQVVQQCRQSQKWTLTNGDVEEVLIAIFQQLAENDLAVLRQFDGQGSFTTFLTVAARRIAIAQLQRREVQGRLQNALQHESSQRLSIPGVDPAARKAA